MFATWLKSKINLEEKWLEFLLYDPFYFICCLIEPYPFSFGKKFYLACSLVLVVYVYLVLKVNIHWINYVHFVVICNDLGQNEKEMCWTFFVDSLVVCKRMIRHLSISSVWNSECLIKMNNHSNFSFFFFDFV